VDERRSRPGAAALADAAASALAGRTLRAVVLVEGTSDQAAVETVARRRGRDLAAEDVAVVAMGGAMSVGGFVARFGPGGLGVRLAGLYDIGEEATVRQGLSRSGLLGTDPAPDALEQAGFFGCDADLEDELIRALGPAAVEAVLAEHGDLESFHRFGRQPAQRGRPVEARLRRFLGTRSGRKLAYGRRLAAAVALDRVPQPLLGALAHVLP
jgi:hypothetical protein